MAAKDILQDGEAPLGSARKRGEGNEGRAHSRERAICAGHEGLRRAPSIAISQEKGQGEDASA
eukprot:10984999-Lingulodinium_polyedra.AAC.1